MHITRHALTSGVAHLMHGRVHVHGFLSLRVQGPLNLEHGCAPVTCVEELWPIIDMFWCATPAGNISSAAACQQPICI